MHTYATCAADGSSIRIKNSQAPLFMHGNIEKAIQLVNRKNSKTKPENFYFFAGACFWEPGQLQRQVLEGTWLPVQGPVDVLLKQTLAERAKASEYEVSQEEDDGDSDDD